MVEAQQYGDGAKSVIGRDIFVPKAMNTSAIMAHWLKETGDHFNQAVVTGGRPTTCSVGCSACCSERLQVTRQEADYVWDALTHEQRKAIIPAVRAWVAKFDALGFGNEIDALDYRRAELICPLLHENRCTVYAARPVACRCHAAIGPPIACSDLVLRPNQLYAMAPELIAHQVQQLNARLQLDVVEITDLVTFLAIRAGVIQDADIERLEWGA